MLCQDSWGFHGSSIDVTYSDSTGSEYKFHMETPNSDDNVFTFQSNRPEISIEYLMVCGSDSSFNSVVKSGSPCSINLVFKNKSQILLKKLIPVRASQSM